jgi:hypothetical protein
MESWPRQIHSTPYYFCALAAHYLCDSHRYYLTKPLHALPALLFLVGLMSSLQKTLMYTQASRYLQRSHRRRQLHLHTLSAAAVQTLSPSRSLTDRCRACHDYYISWAVDDLQTWWLTGVWLPRDSRSIWVRLRAPYGVHQIPWHESHLRRS